MIYSAPMKRPSLVSMFALGALSLLSPAAAQTPPPATPVAFTGFRVVPSQATALVRGIFLGHQARFAACAPGGTFGTVALRMATDANGQVASSTIRHTSFAADQHAISGCVVSASRALRFPGSVQGTLDIEVVVQLGTPPPAAPAH